MNQHDVTPDQASHGRTIPDRDLPMVAAQWLVDGYDSPLLRELASLTSRQDIWWAVDRIDRTHRPYASAQYVLAIIGDYEDLWKPGGGEGLMALLRTWDENPGRADRG